MKSILENPYRIVGLLSGASAREHERQVRRIKQFVEAEQELDNDYSFSKLGKIDRTIDNINAASSKLNLDSDKMQAALFWFFFGSEVADEVAFDAMKVGEFDEAVKVWGKQTQTGTITVNNYSAYNNLGTLYLSGISLGLYKTGLLQKLSTPTELISKGILLKLKFLESDFFSEFKNLVADETYKLSKSEAQLMFLNQILSEIDETSSFTRKSLIECISDFSFLGKDKFLSGFSEYSILQIENNIEKSVTKRKEENKLGITIGESLLKDSQEHLQLLKMSLGASNIKYISIVDKLAFEINQCSIEFYNYYHNISSGYNYVGPALELANKALQIVEGGVVRDRISDTLKTYEKMRDYEISSAIELLQHIRNTDKENQSSWTGKSIDWNKVVELILKTIPKSNMSKIRNVKDNAKLNEYRNLVDFVVDNLNTYQLFRIRHICYWKTEDILVCTQMVYKSLPVLGKVVLWYLVGLICLAIFLGDEAVEMALSVTGVILVLFVIGWIRG